MPDRDALPCPGGRAFCEGLHPLVARGVLERAEAYLRDCQKCRERRRVTATAGAMRVIVERDARSLRRREPSDCPSSPDVGILVSPDSLEPGESSRVLVAATRPLGAEVEVMRVADGAPIAAEPGARGGGPPWFESLSLAPLELGEHRVRVVESGKLVACKRFTVARERRPRARGEGAWKSARGWDGAAESLYSAWLGQLFDAPDGTRWKNVHAVLGDRERNLLFDHLGLKEDSDPARLALRPDCADAPYVLRAYFAWKLALPFGFHHKDEWVTNETPGAEATAPGGRALVSTAELRDFAELLLGGVTAKRLRTPLSDDASDLYPVALEREHLRPGVVFADPWGHTLTLVKWVAQTESARGQLLAVDAQPDGSVGIRRFWRGNFLFVDPTPSGGFGFKAFRPIVREEGAPRRLSNDEIRVARGYGGFSLEQASMTPADFHARMSRLISPAPTAPELELRELVDALMAQLERRVEEVAVADELARERKSPIEMPEGRGMFLSAGPWEAASTPCRDLRLLVGMDAVLAFPGEAARGDEALRRSLEALSHERARALFIEYERSDGTKRRLTLAELLSRRAGFEMAYNPNDCPERRWAAPEDGEEMKSCRRRAPEAQRARMAKMRYWFARRYSCG